MEGSLGLREASNNQVSRHLGQKLGYIAQILVKPHISTKMPEWPETVVLPVAIKFWHYLLLTLDSRVKFVEKSIHGDDFSKFGLESGQKCNF